MIIKNKTYRNVTITSLIAVIMITSGIGVAYADGTFLGKNEFGSVGTNTAYGSNSAAFGYSTDASGDRSVTFGSDSIANATNAAAFNRNTMASGFNSAAFGYYTTASGYQSAAFGHNTISQSFASFVIGRCNDISGTTNSWIATEPLFVIGNGEYDIITSNCISNANAFTVLKDGNVGIGTNDPLEELHVKGTGALFISVESTDLSAGIRIESDSTGPWYMYSPDSSDDLRFTHGSGDKVTFKQTGNVGIGTSSPNSLLQIINATGDGYLQLDIVNTPPPETDCDDPSEYGRMITHYTKGYIYVCEDDGWWEHT